MDCKIGKNIGGGRIAWVDAVKGIAVILVLYAHSLPSSPIEDVISTFHVPLFVVLSGYLIGDRTYEKRESIQRYKKTFKQYILPYFIYALIAAIMNVLVCILVHDLSLMHIVKNAYGTLTGFGGSFALWYTASYLIGLAIYYIIRCNVQKRSAQCLIAFISLVLAIMFDYVRGQLTDLSFWWEYPILTILRSFTFVFYFEVGRCFKVILSKLTLKKTVTICILFFSAIPIAIINGYTNYSFLNHGKCPLALYYCGMMGSLGVILLIKTICRGFKLRLLEWIGKNSLIIMSTHMNWEIMFFTQVFINNCLFRLPEERGILFYIYGMICVLIMLVIEAVIILSIQRIRKKCKI